MNEIVNDFAQRTNPGSWFLIWGIGEENVFITVAARKTFTVSKDGPRFFADAIDERVPYQGPLAQSG